MSRKYLPGDSRSIGPGFQIRTMAQCAEYGCHQPTKDYCGICRVAYCANHVYPHCAKVAK